jgi:environmental stress-induced protein Ves
VIQQPAAYSFFADRTRIHIPIHGNGIRLHFEDPPEVVALGIFQQHRFDGARPVQVELVDGPVAAFNLIAQTDLIAQAEVNRVDAEAAVPAFQAHQLAASLAEGMSVVRVVYAVNGSVALRVAGREAARLEPGDAFVLNPRHVGDNLAERVELCCAAANVAVVAATVVFQA